MYVNITTSFILSNIFFSTKSFLFIRWKNYWMHEARQKTILIMH